MSWSEQPASKAQEETTPQVSEKPVQKIQKRQVHTIDVADIDSALRVLKTLKNPLDNPEDPSELEKQLHELREARRAEELFRAVTQPFPRASWKQWAALGVAFVSILGTTAVVDMNFRPRNQEPVPEISEADQHTLSTLWSDPSEFGWRIVHPETRLRLLPIFEEPAVKQSWILREGEEVQLPGVKSTGITIKNHNSTNQLAFDIGKSPYYISIRPIFGIDTSVIDFGNIFTGEEFYLGHRRLPFEIPTYELRLLQPHNP